MNKKEALTVLIKNTYLLTDSTKKVFLGKIDLLSSEEIENLGKFFALQEKYQIENSNKIMAKLNKLEDQLKVAENNSK